MKKLVFFALVFMVLLSGCSKADEASVPVEETTTTTETITEATTATTTEPTTVTTTEATTTEPATETTTEATTATTTEPATETTTESTTVTTTEPTTVTTEIALTPEELEIYNTMPDIVFVLSHCYYSSSKYGKYSNIRGVYVTRNGEMKMYAFSDEEEGKYRDIPKVYDNLKNVTCSELVFRQEGDEFTQDDLNTVSMSDLIELYKNLMLVDKKAKIAESGNTTDAIYGMYKLYGIRVDKDGEKEIILLSGWGDDYYLNTDLYADEIAKNIKNILSNYC